MHRTFSYLGLVLAILHLIPNAKCRAEIVAARGDVSLERTYFLQHDPGQGDPELRARAIELTGEQFAILRSSLDRLPVSTQRNLVFPQGGVRVGFATAARSGVELVNVFILRFPNGHATHLTPLQFDILKFFMSRPGPYTHAAFVNYLWEIDVHANIPDSAEVFDRALDFINRISRPHLGTALIPTGEEMAGFFDNGPAQDWFGVRIEHGDQRTATYRGRPLRLTDAQFVFLSAATSASSSGARAVSHDALAAAMGWTTSYPGRRSREYTNAINRISLETVGFSILKGVRGGVEIEDLKETPNVSEIRPLAINSITLEGHEVLVVNAFRVIDFRHSGQVLELSESAFRELGLSLFQIERAVTDINGKFFAALQNRALIRAWSVTIGGLSARVTDGRVVVREKDCQGRLGYSGPRVI